jgi:hypothetical protein
MKKNKFNIPLIVDCSGYIIIENYIEHYHSSYNPIYKDRTVNNLIFGINLIIREK